MKKISMDDVLLKLENIVRKKIVEWNKGQILSDFLCAILLYYKNGQENRFSGQISKYIQTNKVKSTEMKRNLRGI